jgi:hypothetical protein
MWLRRSRDKWQAREVVVDAERLLTGWVCDMDDLDGCPNPGWSLMSILTQGNHAGILRLSDSRVTRHPRSWAATLGDLAAELLRVASGPSTLLRLQRRVLVPLELQLLNDEIPVPTSPAQATAVVVGALEEHPTYPDC